MKYLVKGKLRNLQMKCIKRYILKMYSFQLSIIVWFWSILKIQTPNQIEQ